jgi:hypothetical protein
MTPMSDSHSFSNAPRRKRVVAREVNEAEVEASNLGSAALSPAEIFTPDPDSTTADKPMVVDPTTLGRRHRRSSHHKIYRWSQFCTMLSGLLAGIGVVCAMVDEIRPARACAIPALVFGIAATVLAGHNSLAARWRGWAIAAAVFAAAALALTWIEPELVRG